MPVIRDQLGHSSLAATVAICGTSRPGTGIGVPTSAWRAGRGLPAGQPRVPRAMCRIATASSVISYRIRYRPTRSRRRSGDP